MMDKEFLHNLLEHKHEGACFHCYAAGYFKKLGLNGYAALHKHHSKEEYGQYLDLMELYVEQFGELPTVSKSDPGVAKFHIDENADMPHKMEQGLEAYEDYEKEALAFFKEHKRKFNENDPYIRDLIKGTKDELKFIEELEDEMEDGKYHPDSINKLDQWLVKKYDKAGNQVRDKYTNYGRNGTIHNYAYNDYSYHTAKPMGTWTDMLK